MLTIENGYGRNVRMFLYHYYDAKIGPFKNISDLSVDDAKQLLVESKLIN